MLLAFPLDISCAECAAQTVEITVEFEDLGLADETGALDVAAEARCPACGNHVIFGALPARVEP